jgi:hypothetical protein
VDLLQREEFCYSVLLLVPSGKNKSQGLLLGCAQLQSSNAMHATHHVLATVFVVEEKMSKILWVSKYPPLPSQIRRLEALTKTTCDVIHEDRPLYATSIRFLFGVTFSDHLVVDAPFEVLDELCQLGLKPLWPEMEQVGRHDASDTERDRKQYRFKRFQLVTGVRQLDNGEPKLVFLEPCADYLGDDIQARSA